MADELFLRAGCIGKRASRPPPKPRRKKNSNAGLRNAVAATKFLSLVTSYCIDASAGGKKGEKKGVHA